MKLIISFLLICTAFSAAYAQPAPGNDECGDADALDCGDSFSASTDNANNNTPGTGCTVSDEGVWYTFIGDGNSTTISVTATSGWDHEINITSGTCGAQTNIACVDNALTDETETHTFTTTIGVTYFVYVSYWSSGGGTTGDFDISRTCSTPATPPANDDCTGAYPLTVNPDFNCGSTTAGTVEAATASIQSAASCAGTEDDDVWFTFVATGTSHSLDILNTAGSTTDMYHSVWEGTCPALSLVAGTCSDADDQILTGLTAGNTYYVRVYTWTGTAGQNSTFDVCVGTPPPPPANDECAGAYPLTVNPDLNCGTTTAGTVASATASAQDAGACGGTEDDDVWFSFVAVETSHTVDILNAAGSTTDMYHSVWTGNCATTLVAGSCSDADASTLTGLTVGETYYIRVYTWTGTTGQTSTFDVCIGTTPPPGPCVADLSINSTTASISNTTCGFGDDYDSGDACGSNYMGGDDIVIEYNPTTTGCVDLVLTNTDTWTGIFVTDGCPDDPGTSCLSSNTNSGGNPSIEDFNVVAGTSYYITISTFPSPQCTAFDLDITDCPPPTCTDGIQNGTETGIDCGGICAPCPPASAEDCAGGTTVCTDAVIAGNSDGDGDVSDLIAANSGCLGIEHQSSWYYFQAATDGDIELTITTTVDYDFAIWGPYPGAIACPPVGAPLRCSFGATPGNTGLAIGSGDTSEGTGGDEFVDEINATAGDSYIMLIDNFTSDGTNFTLDWTLSSGATLDCTLLPVTFSDFIITKMENSNLLNWNTYSESNNSYFKIQILESDNEFYTIGTLEGQNNSSEITPYVFNHYRPEKRVNTYRIIQVDNDGKETIYTPKTVDNSEEAPEIIGTYNLLGQEVSEDYIGIVIRVHADGTTTKSYQTNQ